MFQACACGELKPQTVSIELPSIGVVLLARLRLLTRICAVASLGQYSNFTAVKRFPFVHTSSDSIHDPPISHVSIMEHGV